MRIWQIALFIFVFQLMFNIGSMGVFSQMGWAGGVGNQEVPYLFNASTVEETEKQINGTMGSTNEGIAGSAIDFGKSVMALFSGIINFGLMLGATALFAGNFVQNIFGAGALPPEMLFLITTVVRIVYIVGILQLFLGRSIKQDI